MRIIAKKRTRRRALYTRDLEESEVSE